MRVQVGVNNDLGMYSEFKDVDEFITNAEIWLIDTRSRFTKGELYGLEQLIQSSTNIPGVCLKTVGGIVTTELEGYNGQAISRSTFKRMVRKCINLGLLEVYETILGNGTQGGNLYVFKPYPPFYN